MGKIYLGETLVSETNQGGGGGLAYKGTYCFSGCRNCAACGGGQYCLYYNGALLCTGTTLSCIVAKPGFCFYAIFKGATCPYGGYNDRIYVSWDSCCCSYSECYMYGRNTSPQIGTSSGMICWCPYSSSTSGYHPQRYVCVDVYQLT